MASASLLMQAAWSVVLRRVRATFPDVRQLSTKELAERLQSEKPPILLDTRTCPEYAVSHLPGARLFDPEISDSALARLWSSDTPIVAYCSIGYRSSAVAQRLTTLGYTNVCNLEGSIFYWANGGGDVVRNGDPIGEVHPFNRIWGLLLSPDLRAPGTV